MAWIVVARNRRRVEASQRHIGLSGGAADLSPIVTGDGVTR